MTARSGGSTVRRFGAVLVASVTLLAACGGSATPRPTDPHKILVDALAATAALPTVRIHVEVAASVADAGVAPGSGLTQMALDADVDLATQPIQIAPPPPALTDDFDTNFGGGGGVVTLTQEPIESILVDVGNELESAMPDEPLPSAP